MKPPPFEYERPESLRGALEALSKGGSGAKLLAGGQSLIPMLNARTVSPSRLIDVSRLTELQYVLDDFSGLRIGALTTHNAVLASPVAAAACPILVEAYAHVGGHCIRNRGTIGGSLCLNDPTSEMPLVAALVNASMVIRSSWGARTVAAADFFRGPFETALQPNEMLCEIRIPKLANGHGSSFLEVSQRVNDRALIAAGCILSLPYGVCTDVRIGLRNAGSNASRIRSAEAELEGKAPSDAAIEAAAAAAARAIDPGSDMHADAAYRRDVAATLVARAARIALARTARPALETTPGRWR